MHLATVVDLMPRANRHDATMIDFLHDEFPDDQRVPYQLIRWRFFSRCYSYCGFKFNVARQIMKPWAPNEHESAYAEDELELAFDLPIENLMFQVFAAIMAGGLQSEQYRRHTEQRIRAILDGRQVNQLLECLDGEELLAFREDLALFNIALMPTTRHDDALLDAVDSGKWPGDQRVPYALIRWRFQDQLYRYARMPANFHCQWEGGWARHEQQSGFAYQAIAPSLVRPLEQLMLEVLVLVLAAGRQSSPFDEPHRHKVAALLAELDRDDILGQLRDDERADFTRDMASIGAVLLVNRSAGA